MADVGGNIGIALCQPQSDSSEVRTAMLLDDVRIAAVGVVNLVLGNGQTVEQSVNASRLQSRSKLSNFVENSIIVTSISNGLLSGV